MRPSLLLKFVVVSCVQEPQSVSKASTTEEVLQEAGSHQQLLKQLHANLEEDQGLFLQFYDKTKGEVWFPLISMHRHSTMTF